MARTGSNTCSTSQPTLTITLSASLTFTPRKRNFARTVGAAPKNPRSAATANGSSISTTPTTPVSNSWNSLPFKNPAAPTIPVPTPDPTNDLPLFPQPLPLGSSTLLRVLYGGGVLFPATNPCPRPRQASPKHRRRNHRFRLRTRWPHRLFRSSQLQNQALRPRTRRHLAPGSWRQAPPLARRPEVHPRQPALQLHGGLLSLVPQWPPDPRPALHYHGRGRQWQNPGLLEDAHPRRRRQGSSRRQG